MQRLNGRACECSNIVFRAQCLAVLGGAHGFLHKREQFFFGSAGALGAKLFELPEGVHDLLELRRTMLRHRVVGDRLRRVVSELRH